VDVPGLANSRKLIDRTLKQLAGHLLEQGRFGHLIEQQLNICPSATHPFFPIARPPTCTAVAQSPIPSTTYNLERDMWGEGGVEGHPQGGGGVRGGRASVRRSIPLFFGRHGDEFLDVSSGPHGQQAEGGGEHVVVLLPQLGLPQALGRQVNLLPHQAQPHQQPPAILFIY